MKYAIETPNETTLLQEPQGSEKLQDLIKEAKKLSKKIDPESGSPQTIYLLAFKDKKPVGQLVYSSGKVVDADGEFYIGEAQIK